MFLHYADFTSAYSGKLEHQIRKHLNSVPRENRCVRRTPFGRASARPVAFFKLALGQCFPHGFSGNIELISIVDEPVQDGVRQSWGRKQIVPFVTGKLPGNHGGGSAVPELGQFGEVKNSAECEHPKSAAYAARPLAA